MLDYFEYSEELINRLFLDNPVEEPKTNKLSNLKDCLAAGLEGRLSKNFYIQSTDCGLSKSSTVKSFLSNWKKDGLKGSGSALIVVPTLDGIASFINGSGLDESHYAIICSDNKLNAAGLGRHKADEAKVLFTTHEQAKRRILEAGSFVATSLFFYHGKPRSLRVWDEGMNLTPYAAVRLKTLMTLPYALSGKAGDAIDAFVRSIAGGSDGEIVRVPVTMREHTLAAGMAAKSLTSDQKRALNALSTLSGQKAVIRQYNAGLSLIGIGVSLPIDMAPMIVLDASARLTDRYEHWHRLGAAVERLPPVTSSYGNARIHWCDIAAGASTLRIKGAKDDRYQIIADLINSKPGEEWLLICSKGLLVGNERGEQEPPSDLADLLTDPDMLKCCTWGLHTGTNKFRTIANVIVLGSYDYDEAAYDAIAMAKLGRLVSVVDIAGRKKVQQEEFAHNLYQAICRSNVRNHSQGNCGSTSIYLLMSRTDWRNKAIEQCFPDAVVEQWLPKLPSPKTKAERIIAAFECHLDKVTSITTEQLRVAASLGDRKDALTKPLKDAKVAEYMKRKGIRRVGKGFIFSRMLSS